MLMFHGTRATNVLGILSQGLKIALLEAPTSGYMFGKGIFFKTLFPFLFDLVIYANLLINQLIFFTHTHSQTPTHSHSIYTLYFFIVFFHFLFFIFLFLKFLAGVTLKAARI